MLGQLGSLVQWDKLADMVPGSALWEEQVEQAKAGDLLGPLLAEVGSLANDALLEEADFEVPDGALRRLVLALRDVCLGDLHVR